MPLSGRASQEGALGEPEVLFAVGAENIAGGGYKVCRVVEDLFWLVPLIYGVLLDNGAGNKTDFQLSGERLVVGQVFGSIRSLGGIERILGDPTIEVVSWMPSVLARDPNMKSTREVLR